MNYYGMTVVVNNPEGAQRIGVDSLSADLLLLRLGPGPLAITANAGDVIIIKPYVQELSWFQMTKMRWLEKRKIRLAEKRLREREELGQ